MAKDANGNEIFIPEIVPAMNTTTEIETISAKWSSASALTNLGLPFKAVIKMNDRLTANPKGAAVIDNLASKLASSDAEEVAKSTAALVAAAKGSKFEVNKKAGNGTYQGAAFFMSNQKPQLHTVVEASTNGESAIYVVTGSPTPNVRVINKDNRFSVVFE